MRHENRRNFYLFHILFVISCSHIACSQAFNTVNPKNKPYIIDNILAYRKSITMDPSRRLVPLKAFITDLITDFKYASSDNFTGIVLYKDPAAFVRLPAALALQKVQLELAKKGVGLKVFDAYRPYSVTEKMWKIVPDERYAANPAKGSGHNRGAAVDVTLVDLATRQELAMPTPFDNFTEKAHHNYMQLSKEVLYNRALLKNTMEKYGFKALSTEWWHYSLPDAEKFELLDLSFSDLQKVAEK